jgi:hypothetical protein
MPEDFATIVRLVIEEGGERHHEARPEDFGAGSGRLAMFRRCLAVLVRRYPEVRVSLSGSDEALSQLGLAPGAAIPVAGDVVHVRAGLTDAPDRVRLTFTRRHPPP